MGYAENRGTYFRARYKTAPGKYDTVKDIRGKTIRFRNKRDAEQAARDAEAAVRGGQLPALRVESMTFAAYASLWYARQDLAPSTMQNYRRHIEEHLLPAFGTTEIADITTTDVNNWEKAERAVPYAPASVKTWRTTLSLILSDAVTDGLRDANPAAQRRGRGRRAGRSCNRSPEKVVTDALGILLIAERAALLSGRDDEFVAVTTIGYTGIRWGELVGLEPQYARAKTLRVEWQLYELDTGELLRCPPKDDSYRTIDLPDWLGGLLGDQVTRSGRRPCACHGRPYVFSGHRAANGAARRPGPKLIDVARRASVSTGTVSAVLNAAPTVAEATRLRVTAAIADLGYVRMATSGELAPHHRRSGFGSWLFRPAATGCYPDRSGAPAHPVPVLADPWPGVPVRGRGAAGRADGCWVPIAPGLTPHGLRHTHKTLMTELGIPARLMDDRLGHHDGSIQARYTHITARMRAALVADLTELWTQALNARRVMSPRSPVAALDRFLRER